MSSWNRLGISFGWNRKRRHCKRFKHFCKRTRKAWNVERQLYNHTSRIPYHVPRFTSYLLQGVSMADKQLTKDSQARTVRGWIFGVHATFIIDVGGRLGYFAELRRRGGAASAQ